MFLINFILHLIYSLFVTHKLLFTSIITQQTTMGYKNWNKIFKSEKTLTSVKLTQIERFSTTKINDKGMIATFHLFTEQWIKELISLFVRPRYLLGCGGIEVDQLLNDCVPCFTPFWRFLNDNFLNIKNRFWAKNKICSNVKKWNKKSF